MRVFAYALLTLCAATQNVSAQSEYWSHADGNAARTAWVDLPGVESQPQEVWRSELGEIIDGPVCWGNRIYCLAIPPKKRKPALVVLDSETGAQIQALSVRAKDAAWLAVDRGVVAVIGSGRVLRYEAKGGKLGSPKAFKGKFVAEGLLANGYLIARMPGTAAAVLRFSSKIELVDEFYLGAGPLTLRDGVIASFELNGAQNGETGEFIARRMNASLKADSVRISRYRGSRATISIVVPANTILPPLQQLRLIGIDYAQCFFGIAPWGVAAEQGGKLTGYMLGSNSLAAIAVQPVAYKKQILGIGADGQLVGFTGSKFTVLIPADGLPAGAKSGEASASGVIAYFGNWAYHLEEAQVLWCAPEIQSTQALIPLPGQRFLAVLGTGELVAYGESRGGELASELASEIGASESSRIALTSQRELDEVKAKSAVLAWKDSAMVLANGATLEGITDYDEAQQTWALRARPDAQPRYFLRRDVAWVKGARPEQVEASELGLLRAWRRYELVMLEEGLGAAFEKFRELRMGEECLRLLDEGRERRIRSSVLSGWQAAAARTESKTGRGASFGNSARREEARIRRSFLDQTQPFIDWAVANGLYSLAGVLQESGLSYGVEVEHLAEFAPGLMDPAAPRHLQEQPEQWRQWARMLIAADAQFVPTSDPCWEAWSGSTWERGTAIQTENLLLVTLSDDAKAIASGLHTAELAMRLLNDWFQVDSELQQRRMEVRVFANRDQYKNAEAVKKIGIGETTAGFYVPGERVSRFYVPSGDAPLSLGRPSLSLNETMVHEITHQFISERALRKDSAVAGPVKSKGFFVVEGFATFMEDQAPGVLRKGAALDNRSTQSLDIVNRLESNAMLLSSRELLSMTHLSFLDLGDRILLDISLRQRAGLVRLNEVARFYQQAGALTYFLIHVSEKCGKQKALDFISNFYLGKLGGEPWLSLGYADPETLDQEFVAFLRGLGGEFKPQKFGGRR